MGHDGASPIGAHCEPSAEYSAGAARPSGVRWKRRSSSTRPCSRHRNFSATAAGWSQVGQIRATVAPRAVNRWSSGQRHHTRTSEMSRWTATTAGWACQYRQANRMDAAIASVLAKLIAVVRVHLRCSGSLTITKPRDRNPRVWTIERDVHPGNQTPVRGRRLAIGDPARSGRQPSESFPPAWPARRHRRRPPRQVGSSFSPPAAESSMRWVVSRPLVWHRLVTGCGTGL